MTHAGRESTSTRNPHSAFVAPAKIKTKDLSKLDFDDRVIEQWRAAFGCPVSDEAKSQFSIKAVGKDYTLSDVRLWQAHHAQKVQNDKDKGKVYLEFFFDGSPSEFEGQEEVFTKAFEFMIEQQLQERRLVEFRQKLSARRRKPDGGGGGGEDASEGGGGDAAWNSYLKTPVPITDLSIRSLREAGCMLRFLVCQTSISTGAGEMLGQIAFQEHFPIDGIAQEASKSQKPMPTWVYYLMFFTAVMTFLTLFAWWQIVKQVALAPIGPGSVGLNGAGIASSVGGAS